MLETLNCNACGAPIEVTSSANFIHCNHCNTNLKIHRTASATFTESVDRLTNTTERLSDQVEKLTRQNELEALDRKWQNERASMMFRDKHGNMHVPSKMGAAGSVVGVAVGILWTIMAIAITQSAPNVGPFAVAKVIFPLFGVVFICVAIFGGKHMSRKANQYVAAEEEYERQRRSLLDDDGGD